MEAEELVKENLGRSCLIYNPESRDFMEHMIVGYCGNDIILSATDDLGRKDIPEGAVLMIHSPLNVSYFVVGIECFLGPKLRKI